MAGFIYDDGGRKEAGYKGDTRDCAVRALAIACQMPYREAYDLVNEYGGLERLTKKRKAKGRSNARTGVWRETFRKIMADLGWTWVATMGIGTGCQVHLKGSELPAGRIICATSRHYVAVVDSKVRDTYDPTRDGTRCVYGYWHKESAQ